jgi:hypothetical protein
MENSLWNRFVSFIKNCFTEKFKTFLPGCCMGFVGAQHLLWAGVPISLVTYVVKYVGTVFMAFGSGLATSYAAYIVDRYKHRKKESSSKKKSKSSVTKKI